MAIFTNQATLSYNNTVTTSNIVTGEVLEVLSAIKNSLDTQYRYGDTVTYVISINNTGVTAFNNLTIKDDLGAYTVGGLTVTPLTYEANTVAYYVNGVLQTTPAVAAGPPLIISGINVPAGGNAIILYEARVNQYAPPAVGSTIINHAEISGAGLTTPIEITDTITVTEEAILSITKSLSPETVAENGQLTYTFTIQNIGNIPAVATDNVTITDVFNPILDNITVALNGTVLTTPAQYAYDSVTGVFQTVASVITVPAATFTQDAITGQWNIVPGVAILSVIGTV